MILPWQNPWVQFLLCKSIPSQYEPLLDGSGLVQVLLLCWKHSGLQLDQDDHTDQPPGTPRIKNIWKWIKNKNLQFLWDFLNKNHHSFDVPLFIFNNECPNLFWHKPGHSLGKNQSCTNWKKQFWIFVSLLSSSINLLNTEG